MSPACGWTLLCAGLIGLAPRVAGAQDTLRVGSVALAGATPPLGTWSYASYKLQDGMQTPINRSRLTIREDMSDDVPVYEVTILHWAAGRDDSTLTRILVRRSDWALLRHKVRATRDSSVVSYSHGTLTGWVVLPDKPVAVIDRPTAHPVLPVDGPAPWFLGALPLAPGFQADVARYSMWADKEVVEEIHVVGSETLHVHGKEYDCWKVDNGPFAMPGYRMLRWVDKTSRRVVQAVLRGGPDQPEYWSYLD
jgi:hypothetical protein